MTERGRRQILVLLLAAGLVLTIGGCGGGSDSAADDDAEATSTVVDELSTTTTATEEEIETTEGSSNGTEPAPSAGRGTLVLDDGRSFTITVAECQFSPAGNPAAGTVEVKGTSDPGSTFELTQFFLNCEWSQSDASIAFPNSDQIYVLALSASSDAEPATVDGKTIRWTRVFKELDESANAHVYTGEGTLLLTCP